MLRAAGLRAGVVGATRAPALRALAPAARALSTAGPKTLFDKVFQSKIVDTQDDGTCLIYIDRHLVHEVTSPQAFEGLRNAGRKVRRVDRVLATADHNVPTSGRAQGIDNPESKVQVDTLSANCAEFGLNYFGMDDVRQGVVHIIGPEQGFTLPGMTIVCGDSHTATHGAFGALAFGIGTSEVEHVLATQTLVQQPAKNMRIKVEGELPVGITSKDLILHIIGVIGTAGGTGHVIEYAGDAISKLSMESRMTICNMSIEAGARAGMIAPDEVTFKYLKGRPMSPTGELWDKAVAYWKTLPSDPGATYDKEVVVNAPDIVPQVTWGTSPEDVGPITGSVPDPATVEDPNKRSALERALDYMGLQPNQKLSEVPVDKVFIGSCTNGRIEDLRELAEVAKGRQVAPSVAHAMIVPGSGIVKQMAEEEGLHEIFKAAGFDWREPGCSMCLAMNEDKLAPGERCASTSNRNFEGRQGRGGRTHLVSPAMAAAAAISGRLTDVRSLVGGGRGLHTRAGPTPRTARALSAQASAAGAMTPFTTLTGVAAPLPIANVDTDMIIPKQFLKTIKRTGLGVNLFDEMRYTADGKEVPSFVLNQPAFRAASVLVARDNFGCGSSREHAPWALLDFGIRCVIAPSFADIFYNNCFKNGILPIVLPKDAVEQLLSAAEASPGMELTVDLQGQVIERAGASPIKFDVDGFRKHCLLNGLDDIGLTLQKVGKIDAYEAKQKEIHPWL